MVRRVTLKEEEISCHEPNTGLDVKTDRLTDLQLECDFEFHLTLTAGFLGLI
jgi:hypothetical protein